ncbi:MAG: hypothetical protein H7126_13910 [Candidatus Parcubacteria bacterium]|nr:hypothetical protein [Leptolyngbyaceae cyanobacterium LF-bin-113]
MKNLIRLNQIFDCEIDRNDCLSFEAISSELAIVLVSGEETVGGITIGLRQLQSLIDYLKRTMEYPTILSSGFQCEIDSNDWLDCVAIHDELVIRLKISGDCVGGITIGRGQIQNLINYLEPAKEVVRS